MANSDRRRGTKIGLKILIVTGEVSGDRHGARLATELKAISPDLAIYAVGGEALTATGATMVADISHLSTIGMIEPIRFLPKLLGTLKRIKAFMAQEKPDLVIPIDCQGFNMLVLKAARKMCIPSTYYIAPQEWQWGTESGGRKVLELADHVIAIFQKEADFYRRLGGDVSFVGHPLIDLAVPELDRSAFCNKYGLDEQRHILSLFPGSRKQELTLVAPVLFEAAKQVKLAMPNLQIAVSISARQFESEIRDLAQKSGLAVDLFHGDNSYDLIEATRFSLLTSGTISLEHVLLNTPCAVGYRFSTASYWLMRLFFAKKIKRIPYISLPNLILSKLVIPEFLQSKFSAEAMAQSALRYLKDDVAYKRLQAEMSEVQMILGRRGVVQRAATSILERLSGSKI
jgi:lipid-A-disaccharide synthase